jgi:hypothetical protein
MTDEFGQLTEKELVVGYWWVTHRLKIKAGLIILAILFTVGIYVNVGWKFFNYLYNTPQHQAMLLELTLNIPDYEQIKSTNAPSPLLLGTTLAIGDKSVGYDLITEVENINQRWWLKEIEYYYIIDGQATEALITNILPSDKKNLIYFNLPSNTSINNVQLFIKRQLWERVKDQSQLDSRNRWLKPVVKVNDIVSSLSLLNQPSAMTSFTITNESPLSFWEVEVQIILWQGSRIVGINAFTVNNLNSGDTRPVEILWPRNFSSDVRTEVFIFVNSLDNKNIRLFPENLPSLIR